ncbi:MAG: DsbC family protein [Thiomicrorhabdus chilensis]|uniref:DsbC family protein n=1 Tax=Thiomicrorhabdus chilensis TaxID=63656 RepID=UPI00299F484E|nr:DsbC family protein [Thiomicrorhabdus chilensis]MDX1347353.1 DsbC family protein [Thiomicrorhabdus chilensis]
MHFLKKSAIALGLVTMFSSVATADDKQVIQAQLNKIIPNAPQAQIEPSVVSGLYEVSVGPMVIYMTADGQYVFNGSLINLETRENLTDTAKSEARKQAMSKVSIDSMIVYPAKGDEKHHITVFTDIDCPYCHKMHKEIPALNEAGITVRYLSYPRAGMGSPSYKKAVSVWCSDKPEEQMNLAMKGQAIEPKSCKNPVAEHMQQAQVFGVNGTPNIILDNGAMLPGYVPAKEVIKILQR